MNRQDVINDNIVDRYLLGQLDEQEQEAFEVFYLSCPETQAELDVTEKLIAGFGASALGRRRLQAVPARPATATAKIASRRANWPALAASLVAAVAIGFALQANRTLDIERNLLARGDINIPIVSLGATRSASYAQPVMLPTPDSRMVFSLDLGLAQAKHYRIELLDASGKLVWSADGLVPDEIESLTFSLPPGLLAAGQYVLRAVPDVAGGDDVTFPILVDLDT